MRARIRDRMIAHLDALLPWRYALSRPGQFKPNRRYRMLELSSPDCLFCKLSAEPASHEIYRDDEIFAILVLCPIRPGHALVLPRAHYPYFDDMPVTIAARIMAFGQHLGRIQKRVFNVERAAFLFTGGDIPHAHAHVLPLHEKTDITSTRYILERDLTFCEAPAAPPGELLEIAEHLRSALKS